MPRLLAAILASVLCLQVFVIAPVPGAAVMVAAVVWMAWPGVAFARRVLGRGEPAGVLARCVGPALGFGFSVFGVFLFWAAGVQNWTALLLGPALTWVLAWLAGRFGGPTLRLPSPDSRDTRAVLLLLFIVPLVTWAPYDHVREPTAEGEAYRAYFTADFVWAMTVTSELAKGEVPPANPFLAGDRLHYYWMAHFLSGALYRNVRGWGVAAEQVILIDGLAFGLAAVAFFYALARVVGASPVWAALAVAVAFLANSYEGASQLWLVYESGVPLDYLRTINIDAVTRWIYHGMPVDGLQRMLLYQPHHLTGYMMCLASLWLAARAGDVTEPSVALWVGICLGMGLLFSSFTAVIVGPAVAVVLGGRLLAHRSVRALLEAAVLGGAPLAVALALTTALAYTGAGTSELLIVGPNPVALRHWPTMLFLSFGPLLALGLAGLARVRWVQQDGAAPAALALSAIAFYFLVDVRDESGVWVGWRSGHLLFISFATIGAAALTAAWQRSAWRVPLTIALVVTLVPAVPTAAIDVYNAQDIANRAQGPDFPWTTIITPDRREALEWLRRSTPPDAIVQMEPIVRGAATFCEITAFAERRMAAGVSGAMIPFKPYQIAAESIRQGVFLATRMEDAHNLAKHMGIDYLFIGPIERRTYRVMVLEMEKRPDLFPPVFQNAEYRIYAVNR